MSLYYALTWLIGLGLAVFYIYWLYTVRQQWRIYFAPIYIMAGCLLLSVLIDGCVFHRAIIASYYNDGGWFSDTKWQVPYYEGEFVALWLVCCSPIVGFVIMLMRLPRKQRSGQAAHYMLLLLVVYPWVAIMSFSAVEGRKPQYYEGSPHTPPIGTYAPTH